MGAPRHFSIICGMSCTVLVVVTVNGILCNRTRVVQPV